MIPDGDRRIERMSDPPQLVPACLPDSPEGRGLIRRPGGQLVEFLQQRDRDREKAPALLLGMTEPAVELVRPVDDHPTSMSPRLYNVKFISYSMPRLPEPDGGAGADLQDEAAWLVPSPGRGLGQPGTPHLLFGAGSQPDRRLKSPRITSRMRALGNRRAGHREQPVPSGSIAPTLIAFRSEPDRLVRSADRLFGISPATWRRT